MNSVTWVFVAVGMALVAGPTITLLILDYRRTKVFERLSNVFHLTFSLQSEFEILPKRTISYRKLQGSISGKFVSIEDQITSTRKFLPVGGLAVFFVSETGGPEAFSTEVCIDNECTRFQRSSLLTKWFGSLREIEKLLIDLSRDRDKLT